MANASSATCWLHPYAHVPNNSHDTVFQTSTTAIHQSTWFYVEWLTQMTRETLQMRITCSTHFRDQVSFLIQPSHNNICSIYCTTILFFILLYIFLLIWQLQMFAFCLLSYQWCMIDLNREKARKWERERQIFPCVPLFRLLQSWRSIKRGICIPPTFTSISSVTGDRISVSVCLPFTPPPCEFVESLWGACLSPTLFGC